jgi:hypothetical protein
MARDYEGAPAVITRSTMASSLCGRLSYEPQCLSSRYAAVHPATLIPPHHRRRLRPLKLPSLQLASSPCRPFFYYSAHPTKPKDLLALSPLPFAFLMKPEARRSTTILEL